MWAELSSIEKGNSECRGYWYGRRQHRLRRHRASRRRAPRCQRTHARMHVQHWDRGGLRAVPAGRTPGPHREGRQPKPMMDGAQQSDAAVVARKAANKGARVPAEPLERRAAAERNPQRTGTVRTQSRGAVSPGAERIRQLVKEKPGERLTALLHHITPEALEGGVSRTEAGCGSGRGRDDVARVRGRTGRAAARPEGPRARRGAYRAAPVRRVEIPKPDGGVRPLGIASLEDKIVQRAVVEQILTPIYESEFFGFSYGFRPGRSAHDALDALAYAVERRKVNLDSGGGHPGVLRQHRAGAADAVPGDAHRGPAGCYA